MLRLMQVVLATAVAVGVVGASAASSQAVVDTTSPTITITAPTEGQHFPFGVAIQTSFHCDDPTSGIATCTNSTPVNAAAGTHTFTVNATDNAGNAASKSVTYTVDAGVDTTPPTITITAPVDGKHYALGSVGGGAFTCDDAAGSGVASCTSPTPMIGTAGTHSYTVNAADMSGNAATKTIAYTVDPVVDTTPPTITITSPSDGQHYGPSTPIVVQQSCADPGGSGVATCAYSTPLDPTPGPHVYTVNATDIAGNAATKSVTYVVDRVDPGPPAVIRITAPVTARSASLRTGVTLSLAGLDANSSAAVRVRRGARTLVVYNTRTDSAGKAKVKLRLSRTQLRSLKGKTLTLRYTVTAGAGQQRVVTRTLTVT